MPVSPSGKQNMMTSLNKWLVAQLPEGEIHDGISTTLSIGKEFWFQFGYTLAALMFPSISIAEVGLFTPGETAIGRVLGIDPTTGQPIKGARNQTLVEINCWAKDTAEDAQAEKTVRDLRDKVMYALLNAGDINEVTDTFVVPPILLKDYSQVVPPTVGALYLDRTPNSINERFIVDPIDANIKRYRMLVRLYWNELA